MSRGYRSRSPRKSVVVPCRINAGGLWTDGCIRNVSTRGMMISAETSLKIGSYVDIRRGTLAITGRVAWVIGPRFGVRTQDDISAEALVGEPVLKQRPSDQVGNDRRAPARADSARSAAARADQSRQMSSILQYICLALLGVGFATFTAVQVYHLLAHPLGRISRALGS